MAVKFHMMQITAFQQSVALLLSTAICITQQTNPQELRKPIDATASVTCTGCSVDNLCLVMVNNVTVNNYTLSQNGNLMLPANDPSIYGTIQCGSSVEQLDDYLICPPNNEQYDWLSAKSNTTVVTEGDTLEISCDFSQMPHSAISLIINETAVSADANISCIESSEINSKIVNYTCKVKHPSIKSIEAHLTFCDIEFFSSPVIITIKALPPNPSMLSTTMTSNSTASSSITAGGSDSSSTALTIRPTPTTSQSFISSPTPVDSPILSIDIATESPSDTTETVTPSDDDNDSTLSGVQITAITVTGLVILFITVVVFVIICCVKQARAQPTPKENTEESDADTDADTEVETMSFAECTSAGHNQERVTMVN